MEKKRESALRKGERVGGEIKQEKTREEKRNIDIKEYIPYGSIYMTFKQAKLNYEDRCQDNASRMQGCQGLRKRKTSGGRKF